MRAAICLLLCASRAATAEPTPVVLDVVERADSIGAVTGMTWDNRPSAGIIGRVGLSTRFALAAQARARSGQLVADMDLIWQVTHGSIAATYGDRAALPIRLELLCGIGLVDRQPIGSFGLSLRVRASRRFTIDIAARDEVSRADRPTRFVHIPEVQLALSWTAPHPVR